MLGIKNEVTLILGFDITTVCFVVPLNGNKVRKYDYGRVLVIC